jgi:hypothetical protein
MAVDINQNVDGDILDDYLWEWLDMGDDKVCPDCARLSSMEPVSFTEWETERTLPGRGDTVCGDRCRCVLYPTDLVATHPDLKSGGKVVIKDIGDLTVSLDIPYEIFQTYDDLVVRYRQATSGGTLPDEIYYIDNIDGRIKYLQDWLRANAG